MVQEPASSDEVLLFFLKYGLAFGLRGDVRVVGPGSVNGTKHLSRDLLWSTHDSVMHAARIYSLWKCILTSKRRRDSELFETSPHRNFLRFAPPYSVNQKRKTHRIWATSFWGPGPFTEEPMVSLPTAVQDPTSRRAGESRLSRYPSRCSREKNVAGLLQGRNVIKTIPGFHKYSSCFRSLQPTTHFWVEPSESEHPCPTTSLTHVAHPLPLSKAKSVRLHYLHTKGCDRK